MIIQTLCFCELFFSVGSHSWPLVSSYSGTFLFMSSLFIKLYLREFFEYWVEPAFFLYLFLYSCFIGTNNLGSFKLNSSPGILWIIFCFPSTIKVKKNTFSYFLLLFFIYHFIRKTFVLLYLFYLIPTSVSTALSIHHFIMFLMHLKVHITLSTLAYIYIINWVHIFLQFFLFRG